MERFCGKCSKEIRDIEPAQCSFCEAFFHVKMECSDVTRSHMQQLFSCGKALWLCCTCREFFANRSLRAVLSDTSHAQSTEIESLRTEMKKLTDVVMTLQHDMSKNHSAVMDKIDMMKSPATADKTPQTTSKVPRFNQLTSLSVKRRKGDNGQSVPVTASQAAISHGTKDLDLSDLSIPEICSPPAPPKFWLYLAGLNPKITDNDVIKIVSRCLEIEDKIDVVRLVPKGADTSSYTYVSYKIGLEPAFKEKALDKSSWPKNLQFREFVDLDPKNFRS